MSLGGLVGGEWGTTSYFDGGGGPALISNGRLYYNMPTASGTMMTCVDLRTGELIWQTAGSISAGRNLIPTGIYEYGGSPIPMLWQYSSSSWRRYDAWSGALSLNIAVNTTYLGGPVWLDKDVCYVLRNAGIPLYYTTTSGGGVGVQVA